jgi:anti-anti-sigma regulatory factor
MGITLDDSGSQAMIGLNGVVDISSAAEFKMLLLRALNSGKEVRVSLSGATALDVTAVQLLWSAEREATRAGTGLSFTGPAPAEVYVSLCEVDLQQFLVTDS